MPSRENIGNEANDSPHVTRSSPEPSTFTSQSAKVRPEASWWLDAKMICREFGCMKGAKLAPPVRVTRVSPVPSACIT